MNFFVYGAGLLMLIGLLAAITANNPQKFNDDHGARGFLMEICVDLVLAAMSILNVPLIGRILRAAVIIAIAIVAFKPPGTADATLAAAWITAAFGAPVIFAAGKWHGYLTGATWACILFLIKQ